MREDVPSLVKDILTMFSNHLKQWNTSPTMSENQFAEQAVLPYLGPVFLYKKEFEVSKYVTFLNSYMMLILSTIGTIRQ